MEPSIVQNTPSSDSEDSLYEENIKKMETEAAVKLIYPPFNRFGTSTKPEPDGNNYGLFYKIQKRRTNKAAKYSIQLKRYKKLNSE